MSNEMIYENKVVEQLNTAFKNADAKVVRDKRVTIKIESSLVPAVLTYARDYLNFDHFSHMSIVDWLEEGEFELVYILWSYEDKIQLLIKTRIPRENASFITVSQLWRQAQTYEREISEMYGVHFEGNKRLTEFILEDWDEMPPMRRDFDTVQFAQENFADRQDARKDSKNVRDVIAERSNTEVPDFAKPYSLR